MSKPGYCIECESSLARREVHYNEQPYHTKAPEQVSGAWWFTSSIASDGLCERCYTKREEEI